MKTTDPVYPHDMMPRLFHPFAQGPRTLDRHEGGWGWGSRSPAALRRLHGGAISVQGVESRGSRFIVTIPMASDAAEAAAIQPPRDKGHGLSHRVLVVDDNADATEMLHAALSNAGHVVPTAATASDALAVATDLEPEVAILDIGLPDIDGYELARRLRQSHSTMRLIALTGYGQTGGRHGRQDRWFRCSLREARFHCCAARTDRRMCRPPLRPRRPSCMKSARNGRAGPEYREKR